MMFQANKLRTFKKTKDRELNLFTARVHSSPYMNKNIDDNLEPQWRFKSFAKPKFFIQRLEGG